MIKYAALVIAVATPLHAQEKTFDFKGITNIEVRNGITVNVTQGDEISITGSAVSGDVEQFHLRKFGPWLAVNRHTRWFIFPYGRQDDLVLNVTLPDVRALKAYDDSQINAGTFSGERIRAEALEGGTVTLGGFNYTETSLYATENGTLQINGVCETLEAEAIIGATIDASALDCAIGTVDAQSKAVISVPDTLEIVAALPETE